MATNGHSRSPRRLRAAVGYLRRSTDRQEQSIPDQQRAVERFCDEEGLELIRCYTDDAISGTTASKRPAFLKMVEDAQQTACDFSHVVCYDVKRFGRLDNDEAGYYRHVLRTHGVDVHYATEGFNGSETDDLLRPVKQWQARQESKDLSKVTIRGLLSRIEGGFWMGGAPPHGYDLAYENERGEFLFVLRYMPDRTKQMLDENGRVTRTLWRDESISVSKRDRARLVPGEPERVRAIREIFRLNTEENRGLKAIADRLNRNGVATPRNEQWASIYSGLWSQGTIRAILTNPSYVGDLVWNRRTDARFHRIADGRAVERKQHFGSRLTPNHPDDWITIRDAHPALISRRTWEAAKSCRHSRGGKGGTQVGDQAWNGSRSRFILSGLITCGRCGARYQGCTRAKGKPRKDGTRIKTSYYACGGYIAKGRKACTMGSIRQEELEAKVIDEVLRFYNERYGGPDGRERLIRAVQEHLGAEASDLAEARRRLDADRERVESSIAGLLDNLSPTTRDLAEERLSELRTERDRLERRAEELERLAGEESRVQEMVQEVATFLAGLEQTLRFGTNEGKKVALRRCVDQVVIDANSKTSDLRILPRAR